MAPPSHWSQRQGPTLARRFRVFLLPIPILLVYGIHVQTAQGLIRIAQGRSGRWFRGGLTLGPWVVSGFLKLSSAVAWQRGSSIACTRSRQLHDSAQGTTRAVQKRQTAEQKQERVFE